MNPKALLLPVLLVLSLAFAACGSDSSTDSSSTSAEATTEASEESSESSPAPSGEAQRSEKVQIVEFTYGPDPVVVQTGGKVIWQNEDTAPHTATADDGSFDTGVLERGKIKAETFKQAGTYPYFCEIHPTMHGTVEVVDKS